MNGIDPQTGTALCSRRRLISGATALIAVPVFVRGAFGQESRRPTPATGCTGV